VSEPEFIAVHTPGYGFSGSAAATTSDGVPAMDQQFTAHQRNPAARRPRPIGVEQGDLTNQAMSANRDRAGQGPTPQSNDRIGEAAPASVNPLSTKPQQRSGRPTAIRILMACAGDEASSAACRSISVKLCPPPTSEPCQGESPPPAPTNGQATETELQLEVRPPGLA